TGKYPHSCGVPVNDVPLPASPRSCRSAATIRVSSASGAWKEESASRFRSTRPAPGRLRILGGEHLQPRLFSSAILPRPLRADPDPGLRRDRLDRFGNRIPGKRARAGKPFCLYWQPPTPHDPYIAPPGFEKMYDPERIELRKNWQAGAKQHGTRQSIAGYYAAIACLDEQIGRLLKKLDEIGQRDNTIVFVTSDHGDMQGSQGTFLKRRPWEESVRVPEIFRWPAALKPRQSDAPFSHVDVVPTLLNLCGGCSAPQADRAPG